MRGTAAARRGSLGDLELEPQVTAGDAIDGQRYVRRRSGADALVDDAPIVEIDRALDHVGEIRIEDLGEGELDLVARDFRGDAAEVGVGHRRVQSQGVFGQGGEAVVVVVRVVGRVGVAEFREFPLLIGRQGRDVDEGEVAEVFRVVAGDRIAGPQQSAVAAAAVVVVVHAGVEAEEHARGRRHFEFASFDRALDDESVGGGGGAAGDAGIAEPVDPGRAADIDHHPVVAVIVVGVAVAVGVEGERYRVVLPGVYRIIDQRGVGHPDGEIQVRIRPRGRRRSPSCSGCRGRCWPLHW